MKQLTKDNSGAVAVIMGAFILCGIAWKIRMWDIVENAKLSLITQIFIAGFLLCALTACATQLLLMKRWVKATIMVCFCFILLLPIDQYSEHFRIWCLRGRMEKIAEEFKEYPTSKLYGENKKLSRADGYVYYQEYQDQAAFFFYGYTYGDTYTEYVYVVNNNSSKPDTEIIDSFRDVIELNKLFDGWYECVSKGEPYWRRWKNGEKREWIKRNGKLYEY